jgi:hypothetical protein
MILDPNVWGPHFWFFLHTIALHYPKYPNAVSKKKYYDFLSNLPLFIPVDSISVHFSKLLDEYPITPYLDNRDSLIKWMHFIHNKINESLEKPKISLSDFYINYYNEYKPKIVSMKEIYRWKEKLIYTIVIIFIVSLIMYLQYKYNK